MPRLPPVFINPVEARPPPNAAQQSAKRNAKQVAAGRVQWGRIYVDKETLAAAQLLTYEWRFANRSQLVEAAIKHLAKLTREGLERIEV